MEKITNIKGRLLEGCVWDEKKERLYFLDIEKFRIYCWREKEGLSFLQLHTFVSAVALNGDSTLTAALSDGLYRVDFDSGKTVQIMQSGFLENLRYNDGKCDMYGDFWVGSMYADQEKDGARGGGSLFCISNGKVIAEYPGYTIPNGMDWENGLFFHTETSEKRISVYRQEPGVRGKIGEKLGEIDLSKESGAPDGMCIDESGYLWIAMWGGSQVIGYDPAKGEIFERIPVPDQNVSCCVFGGKEGNRLFITTARDGDGEGGEVYTLVMKHYGKAGYRYGGR